ncbi:hypothetical protein [Umezawaea tangerina]|uniref:Uncharacterized protein n=1 Tax=Umezawaea tangerina TaxID=84725 RepID=A0A2T0T3U5_9PSEU|nr:hypothetical protein [Umezawaea tangerina]PRY40358.1 hypothetical protein CLV43_10693 [Umezawaea tangerina]
MSMVPQVRVDEVGFLGADVRGRVITEFIANVKLLRVLPVGSVEYRAVEERVRGLGPGVGASGLLEVMEPRDAEVVALLSG